MKSSLFKDLARSGWHSSIMTTYSVDPAFYDGSIEYRLRTYGCENNILMADAVMLKRALNATPEAFRNAGRRYVIAPIQVPGCFHPKIHLRLGTDKARLIIGSANATAAGWGSNQEIITAIDWSRRGDDTKQTRTAPLIKKAYNYLHSWLRNVDGDCLDFKLRLHSRDSAWLSDFEENQAPIELDDGSAIDIFCETGDGTPGMFDRLVTLLSEEKIKRLIIVSPYWDADLAALRDLQSAFNFCPTVVALNPHRNDFPTTVLDHTGPTEFASIHDGEDSHRFLHAKVFLIETDMADHLLFGSANCSDDALGRFNRTARNAEVSVYRRVQAGLGLELLDIDLGTRIRPEDIRPTEASTDVFESGLSAIPAGVIELVDRALTWFPPSAPDPIDARIIIEDEGHVLTPIGNGQFRAQLATEPNFPLVVRIKFKDGQVSDPIVVHDETALKLASPGVTDRKLRAAFNRVLDGEEDIIDLALQAHLLFNSDGQDTSKQGHAVERPQSKSQVAVGHDYETAEEFRRAVTKRPATGDSGRFGIEDPGLLELLSIVLKGVTDVGGKSTRKFLDDEEDRDLLAGETEDGEENDSSDQEDVQIQEFEVTKDGGMREYTAAEIERRKKKLLKALDGFDEMLSAMSSDPMLISNRLTAQTAFILNLMLYACSKEHLKPDGSKATIMEFAPSSSGDRDLTFAVRAGRILKQIWVGGKDVALVDYMPIDPRHETMPDDFFFLIVMSRWAIARAFLAVVETSQGKQLSKILQASAVEIFGSSLRYGPIDPQAEQEFIERLEVSLGFEEKETKSLIEHCRRFSADLGGT